MHDTAVPTANFYGTQTSGPAKLDSPAPARLGYDSFQLLSSATMHDVSKPEPNFKRSRRRADAWRLVRPQSA
jgi:hypothetical protein